MELALLTSTEHPLPATESVLLEKFATMGVQARAVAWEEFDFKRDPKQVLIRTPWNYFKRTDEFRAFLDRTVAHGVRLINDQRVILWNMDKSYLVELDKQGLSVVPLHYVPKGDAASARILLASLQGQAHVIKPAISGGSWNTVLAANPADASSLDLAGNILHDSGLIVQAFVDEVVTEGEWSFVIFNGQISHHILKTPNRSDFRSQPQFGSTITVPRVPMNLLASVQSILKNLPFGILPYVRIDGIQRAEELRIMEIEAIEPALFFEYADEGALDRFVAAIIENLR